VERRAFPDLIRRGVAEVLPATVATSGVAAETDGEAADTYVNRHENVDVRIDVEPAARHGLEFHLRQFTNFIHDLLPFLRTERCAGQKKNRHTPWEQPFERRAFSRLN